MIDTLHIIMCIVVISRNTRERPKPTHYFSECQNKSSNKTSIVVLNRWLNYVVKTEIVVKLPGNIFLNWSILIDICSKQLKLLLISLGIFLLFFYIIDICIK